MKIRKVARDGSINLEGRKYESEELLKYIGQPIQVFVDPSINRADAVCFDMDGEFITNAHNSELWAELMSA